MLNIPHQERKAFKKHFIKQAFIEIRFEKVTTNWNEILSTKIGGFSKSLKLDAKLAYQSEMFLPLNNDGTHNNTANVSQQIIGVDLISADLSLIAQVRNDRLIITANSYLSFEKMWSLTEPIANYTKEILNFEKIDWIGIRKVNVLGVNVDEGEYLGQGFSNAFFVPIRNSNFSPGNLKFAENSYIVGINDATCIIKLITAQQSKKSHYDAVFDIDVSEFTTNCTNIKDLKQTAENINETIFDIFCWVTSEDLKNSLS